MERNLNDVFEPADDAGTPLTFEESQGLIPTHIAFRDELNAAEQSNVARGQEWALGRRRELLEEKFMKELHRRMLGDVWRWAGKFRTSARNIGIDYWSIPIELRHLLDDAKAWLEFQTYPADEICVRLHHRPVFIHPFPNGNGRHARLMADLLGRQHGIARLSWGRGSLVGAGELRARYIAALQAADAHDLNPLLAFARS